jgi:peptide deformylase
MILEVVKYPDLRLSQKSRKAVVNDDLKSLVQDMLDTMNSYKDPTAAGLSAVQVGTPLKMLIARDFITQPDTSPHDNTKKANVVVKDYVLVNPKYISLSKEKEIDWEGCLSFPDQYGKVERHYKIKLKYQNTDGAEERLTASGFLARVIQHEMDHLDGITFNTKVIGKMFTGEELDTKTKENIID